MHQKPYGTKFITTWHNPQLLYCLILSSKTGLSMSAAFRLVVIMEIETELTILSNKGKRIWKEASPKIEKIVL